MTRLTRKSTLCKSPERALRTEGDDAGDYIVMSNTEGGHMAAEVWLPFVDWCDMGSPNVVTVTIEPGDLLNTDSVNPHSYEQRVEIDDIEADPKDGWDPSLPPRFAVWERQPDWDFPLLIGESHELAVARRIADAAVAAAGYGYVENDAWTVNIEDRCENSKGPIS